MAAKQHVLIAPLDWGLGHAARCVPLIRRKIEEGEEVTLAASGDIAAYLRDRFPSVEIIELKGYGVRYHRHLPAWVSALVQTPMIQRKISEEHRWLDGLLQRRHFDAVISDNRYGLWSKKAKCIIITHQLYLRLPPLGFLFRKPVDTFIRRLIEHFDECWIPDVEKGNSLSGALSHGSNAPRNIRYIGWLSRFEKPGSAVIEKQSGPFDTVILLSGPEPKRTILEKKLVSEAEKSGKRTLVIRGRSQPLSQRQQGNITFWPVASDEELAVVLQKAEKIICRPGYSTLMDLMTLGLKAELIPTPGQTEQEYLAERMYRLHGWKTRKE